MKVNVCLWICLLSLCFTGCDPPQPPPKPKPGILPPPQIEVEITETLKELSVSITFQGPEATQPEAQVRKRVPLILHLKEDELDDYRKEVEFLLGKLNEAQQKQEKRNTNSLIESVRP